MSNWPLVASSGLRDLTFTDGANIRRSIPLAASDNALSPWSELVASTPACDMLSIGLNLDGGNTRRYALSLALGAAGSEEVVFPDLFCELQAFRSNIMHGTIPLRIPAGARLSAAIRCNTVAGTMQPNITVGAVSQSGRYPIGFSRADVFNFNPATTDVAAALSGVADGGAVTEIIAATARQYHAAMVTMGPSETATVRLFVGGAGSEVMVSSGHLVSGWVATTAHFGTPFPVVIPQGVRVGLQMLRGSAGFSMRPVLHLFY